MKIKQILIITIILFTVSCVSGTTITVETNNNNNTNLSFSSIQDAIDRAQENDFIIIHNGTYSNTLIIDKPLSISSFSLYPEAVIITSNNSSVPIIHVIADNVKISGLTITGNVNNPPITGIFIDHANNSLMSNNIITNTQDGLWIDTSSGDHIQDNTVLSNTAHGIYIINSTLNYLENNNIHNNKRGLYLNQSDQNTVTDNKINNNQNYGIALRKSNTNKIINNQLILNNIGLSLTSSDQNTITNNNASNNENDGILLWIAKSNILKNNVLTENKNSGIYFLSSSSNNTLDGNILSNNLNGISIEGSNSNFIRNNMFNSNENYGIYHLFAGDKNTIEDNSFSDNPSENLKISLFHQIIVFVILLIIAVGIAFYFNLPWLKKGLAGLIILIVILLVLTIIWYLPFESDLPENNVYIEDFEKSIMPINETLSRITFSMNLDYLNKDSILHTNSSGDMINRLPIFVKISASTPADGFYSDEDMILINDGQVVLEYLESNHYECTINMETGKTYDLLIEVQLKRELPYPHPYYGEIKWELIGVLADDIDLRK